APSDAAWRVPRARPRHPPSPEGRTVLHVRPPDPPHQGEGWRFAWYCPGPRLLPPHDVIPRPDRTELASAPSSAGPRDLFDARRGWGRGRVTGAAHRRR